MRSLYSSPLGLLLISESAGSLTGLEFATLPPALPIAGNALLRATAEWLDAYFKGDRPDPGVLPVALQGSPYQRAIWNALSEIPYGRTISYGELAVIIAGRLGRKACAQAAGGAVGRNPVPVIIPCHRVIAAGGKPGGFHGGLARKLWLLRHEQGSPSAL